MNPFAKEFLPALPSVAAKPIRTGPRNEENKTLASSNSLNHPNVRPGQFTFESLKSSSPPVPLPFAPASSSASASGAEDTPNDDLGELDEASLLEHHAALQSLPSLTVSKKSTSADKEQQPDQGDCTPPGTPPQTAGIGAGYVTSPMYNSAAAHRALGGASGSTTPDQQDTSEPSSPNGGQSSDQRTSSSSLQDRVGPEDFELLRVVGQGAFGKVFQVRMKATAKVYAMKIMRKEKILERDHGEYVKSERDVLTAVFHPYIVTLRYSFQTATKLYLVLDFINGGHLFFQLYRAGIFDEQLARLYTAEMVLAISHLHSLNTIHRDLKPENVLLDSEGHIKVTDFGLAKGNMDAEGRTNSFIGTMEYMAPEIIQGQGHGKAVDWWSMGILLYEMLCGMPPFRAKGRQQLQKQIMSAKLKLPPYLSTDAQSLLRALLARDPTKRLGNGPNGSTNVQKHPFFKAIKWDRLMERQVASPFKPSCRNEECVANFDKVWTDQPVEDSPCASPTRLPSNLQSAFEGFSYTGPSLLANLVPQSLMPQAT